MKKGFESDDRWSGRDARVPPWERGSPPLRFATRNEEGDRQRQQKPCAIRPEDGASSPIPQGSQDRLLPPGTDARHSER